MESNKSVFWSKLGCILLAVLIIGGVISYAIPNEISVETQVPGETIYNTTEVLVDNGNLDLVLDHIYDNDGVVEYLLDDLDDDEVEQIADRIVFVNEIKKLAADYVDAEMADTLDKEEYTIDNETVKFDEDDIERVKVKSDADEIVVDDIDFEDSDANLLITVDFEQDDVDYTAIFDVEIKDGEVDDIEIVSVDLD